MLFGADPTPRIVAIELAETGTVKVHRREKDGSTTTDVEPFHPFVWADSDVVDLGIEAEKLKGDLKFGWLITVDSWKELIALRNGLKNAGRDFFAFTDPVQHYLAATGRTLFKDLPFEELKRMQIEVLSFSEGANDHIMSIALSDNSGWEELIIVDLKKTEESERSAIKRVTSLIKERDPDVIEGHNLFRFDLPYLVARAKKLKTKLDWGRSGGFLRSRPSRLQIAEKTIDYPKFTIDGRHFVDTFLLAQFYDVGMRSLTGFERTDVARHFGLCDEEISALTGKELERAYTDIFFTGVARNVWHCDVASLYPSIMLQFDCFPQSDRLEIFRHLLTDLRTFRLETKAAMRAEKEPAHQHHLQALQNTFKILINSFYGYLGFGQGHFADFDAAARVTQIGRDLLKKMIDWLNAHGAKVIEVDTDGIYFVPPNKIDIGDLQKGLAKELPPGIEVEFDEQFAAMFSYKAKNYALLTKDGDVIIRGGALKSRGLEKFQRVFLEEMIKLIMKGKSEAISRLRDEFEQKIRNREWKIEMLMKTDTLQDSLDKYRAKIAGSARNRAASYELALASGHAYKPGDQVSYYIKC